MPLPSAPPAPAIRFPKPPRRRLTGQQPTGPKPDKPQLTLLWARVLERLKKGEILLTNAQFCKAMAKEYTRMTGFPTDTPVLREISQSVIAVHRDYPQTFRAFGVQNRLDRAFEAGARRLNWDAQKIQQAGVRSIYRFNRQDKVRALLQAWRVAAAIDPYTCVTRTLDTLKPDDDATIPVVPTDTHKPAQVLPVIAPHLRPHLEAATTVGGLDQLETAEYLCRQDRTRQDLERREQQHTVEHLEVYVEEGLLTAAEAENYLRLKKIEEQEKHKKIGRRQAAELRTQVLPRERRKLLDYKVKAALSLALDYLHAFDGLKRIGDAYDETLEFLVQHQRFVTARRATKDQTLALTALRYNRDVMEHLCDIMERREQEIRFLAVRLPPYKAVIAPKKTSLGKLTIEADFIADLRQLSLEEMSARLNSDSAITRSRAASDIRSFIYLIEQVIQPTPFRKQVRILRFDQLLREQSATLADLYKGATDVSAGRRRALMYVGRSAQRTFHDLSRQELAALSKSAEQFLVETEVGLRRRQTADAAVSQLFDRQDDPAAKAKDRTASQPQHSSTTTPPAQAGPKAKTDFNGPDDKPEQPTAPRTANKLIDAQIDRQTDKQKKQEQLQSTDKSAKKAGSGQNEQKPDTEKKATEKNITETDEETAQTRFSDMPLIEEPVDIQVVRVRVRAGNGHREIRAKIMPDPDKPSQYVIAGRDPHSGRLLPQTQRGRKRIVEKAPRGIWRIVSGG